MARQDRSPPGAARRVAAAAGRRRRQVVEVVPTDLLVWEPGRELRRPRTRVEVEVRAVGAATAGEWQPLLPPRLRPHAAPYVARGDRGYLASVDGAFAGWVWRSTRTHRDPYSGLKIRLAPDEAYAYGLDVEPEQRPNGVAAALMVRMLEDVRDDPQLTRVYGWVDKRNRSSQALLRLLGFKQAQEVRRVHVLRRVGRQLPRSDRPRFGPLSAAGRHSAG